MKKQLPNYQKEIIELHQFFQDWFQGKLPQTHKAFQRFSHVLHSAFTIIPPSGALVHRDVILDGLYKGYAQNSEIEIWVSNITLHYHMPQFLIATYHEHQKTVDGETRRISTVTFQPDNECVNNLSWLHVHETWLSK